MKTKLIILIVLFISIYANAQQTLTLEDCYSLATKNYPLSKQTGLIQQKSSYEIETDMFKILEMHEIKLDR